MKTVDYQYIIVESFNPTDTSGRHGITHIRPVKDQGDYKKNMYVSCSRKLITDYSIGTKFKILSKITDREGGIPYIYSNPKWLYFVIDE